MRRGLTHEPYSPIYPHNGERDDNRLNEDVVGEPTVPA